MTPEQEELLVSRLNASVEEVQKIYDLIPEILEDEASRLPYLPIFYRNMKAEEEFEKLEKILPKLEEVRTEQFCAKACENEGKDCISIYTFR